MRGQKKQYGRFNVQNQNARGQVKHATPFEQRQFLIRQIERQEKQKALHAEEQRRQQARGLPAVNIPQSRLVIAQEFNPVSRNQNGDRDLGQNRSNAAGGKLLSNLPIQRSSLIEDDDEQEQVNNLQRVPLSQEQQISQQYSQIIGNSQQMSQNTQQRIENLNLEVSFTSNYKDLNSYPLRAQGREIFLRSQSTNFMRLTEKQAQAAFMMQKFGPKPENNLITLKPGPSFEEFLKMEVKKEDQEENQRLRNQFYGQNPFRPNIGNPVNPFRPVIRNLPVPRQDPQENSIQPDFAQSDILSVRSSQQSQNQSSDQLILFSNLQNLQSQESLADINELEIVQSQVVNPVKRNEKKELKRQSIHEKFSRKYQHYQQALRLNPEIAHFNKKELREHFSQPQINYFKKLAVIEMRFGSSDIDQIDFESTQASIKEISEKLGLKYRSVTTIIRRFRLQRRLRTKKQIIRKQSKMRKHGFEYILDPQILSQWAPYSLEKRCQLIFERSNVRISRVTLANYYKKNKIKYGKPQYTIHSSQNEEELIKNRQGFITKIVEYYYRGLEIIYIDECSTHLWEKKNKVWVPRAGNVNIKLPTSRKESVTVIGAISSKSDKLYYCFCNSTNRHDVLFFFEGLNSEKSELKLQGKVVVLDNHSSHITQEIRDYIVRQGATLEFLPVASSYFNPIETMWAWIKAKWRKKLLEPKDFNPGMDYLLKELQMICDTVPPHVVRHISAHCFKILKSYIEEKLMQ